MNSHGAYKKLLYNSKQALFAAIEIYNKPKFDYREEVFVILLVNAWDLLLLAILSKNKKRIFQKKKRGQPYKTLDFNTSYQHSKQFFSSINEADKSAIKNNLDRVREYRNNAVHFYGKKDTQLAIYGLSQSAIKNYVDLLKSIFEEDMTNEINIVLLPLSFNSQPDFIDFFQSNDTSKNNEFVTDLIMNLQNLKKNNANTNRFITVCSVKIESTKNIKSADFISSYDGESNVIAIQRINPDDSFPFYQKDIIGNKNQEKHNDLNKNLNSYSFQAIVWVNKLKTKKDYCWTSNKGGSSRYSHKVINFINNLSEKEIIRARQKYTARNQSS